MPCGVPSERYNENNCGIPAPGGDSFNIQQHSFTDVYIWTAHRNTFGKGDDRNILIFNQLDCTEENNFQKQGDTLEQC